MTRFAPLVLISVVATVFAVFPLTDTDIWWHLACAREWVSTWTPVRSPVINVHYFFQKCVYAVYGLGGAPLLVSFKAILWGCVCFLFLRPFAPQTFSQDFKKSEVFGFNTIGLPLILLFVLRYQMEMRPILFSLVFLGIYWNVLPWMFRTGFKNWKVVLSALLVVLIQWLWCKCQGLFILGPIFATVCCIASQVQEYRGENHYAWRIPGYAFVAILFAMPFFHHDGLGLFMYPFGLFDRLVGVSASASSFAREIAENRSPITLLLQKENVLQSALIVVISVCSVVFAVAMLVFRRTFLRNHAQSLSQIVWLLIVAVLALLAERNLMLLLPVALAYVFFFAPEVRFFESWRRTVSAICSIVVALLMGLWCRSLVAYDMTLVSKQRVPIEAAAWMAANPHEGRLFNDDRAGGYLAFANPSELTYLDGRFILKTAEFFDRYLTYAKDPAVFMRDADSLKIGRAIFPLQYYARWGRLLMVLSLQERWRIVYRDPWYVVFDHEL